MNPIETILNFAREWRWAEPVWLLGIPVSIAAWILARVFRGQTATHDWPRIKRVWAGAKSLHAYPPAPARSRGLWLMLAAVCTVLALARPQWGRLETPLFEQSREVLIAVDLSRSMLADDIKPSRLDRARLLLDALLGSVKGERVGLLLFSGTAFLQNPMSSDYEVLREFLPELKPEFLPEQGTDYDAMLREALDAFSTGNDADRFLVVLSDGESLSGDWRRHIAALKERGVRVIALGIGTADGSLLPAKGGGYLKDDNGAAVMSKLEPATLQELANATNGVYQDASAWVDINRLIQSTVETGKKGRFSKENQSAHVERYQWFLGAGLVFLMASLIWDLPVRPQSRKIAAATLLGLLCLSPARASNPSPAPAAPAPEVSPLVQSVSRLAEKARLSAEDCSLLATETINDGQTKKQAGTPAATLKPLVEDALEAVKLGRADRAGAADWDKLEKELRALLQDEKKQDQQQDQKNQDQNQDQKQDQNQNQKDSKQNQQQNSQSQSGGDSQKQDKPDSSKSDNPKEEGNENKPKPEPAQQQDAKKNESGGDEKKDASEQGDKKEEEGKQPQPPAPMQQVGGDKPKDKSEKENPTSVSAQKLKQIKEKDPPAELFQILQKNENQTGDEPEQQARPESKNKKSW